MSGKYFCATAKYCLATASNLGISGTPIPRSTRKRSRFWALNCPKSCRNLSRVLSVKLNFPRNASSSFCFLFPLPQALIALKRLSTFIPRVFSLYCSNDLTTAGSSLLLISFSFAVDRVLIVLFKRVVSSGAPRAFATSPSRCSSIWVVGS